MASLSRRQRLEAMLVEDPGDVELRYMLAMEHASEGDDAAALVRFQELISQTPNYPHAYHQAARTLERLGRYEEAKACLQKGIPVAQKAGDLHAAGEMQGLLEGLE